MIMIITRSSWSSVTCGGRNSCSTTTATNSSVISGTPRKPSMNATDSARTSGSCERRPSASRTPSGSDRAMPASPATRFSMKPPKRSVGMASSPKPPVSNTAARSG